MRLMKVACTQLPEHHFESAGANSGYLLISFRLPGSCGRLEEREREQWPVCVLEGGGERVCGYRECGTGT